MPQIWAGAAPDCGLNFRSASYSSVKTRSGEQSRNGVSEGRRANIAAEHSAQNPAQFPAHPDVEQNDRQEGEERASWPVSRHSHPGLVHSFSVQSHRKEDSTGSVSVIKGQVGNPTAQLQDTPEHSSRQSLEEKKSFRPEETLRYNPRTRRVSDDESSPFYRLQQDANPGVRRSHPQHPQAPKPRTREVEPEVPWVPDQDVPNNTRTQQAPSASSDHGVSINALDCQATNMSPVPVFKTPVAPPITGMEISDLFSNKALRDVTPEGSLLSSTGLCSNTGLRAEESHELLIDEECSYVDLASLSPTLNRPVADGRLGSGKSAESELVYYDKINARARRSLEEARQKPDRRDSNVGLSARGSLEGQRGYYLSRTSQDAVRFQSRTSQDAGRFLSNTIGDGLLATSIRLGKQVRLNERLSLQEDRLQSLPTITSARASTSENGYSPLSRTGRKDQTSDIAWIKTKASAPEARREETPSQATKPVVKPENNCTFCLGSAVFALVLALFLMDFRFFSAQPRID
eukprot:gene13932-19863_t